MTQCADSRPYSADHPAPTDEKLAQLTLTSLRKLSTRFGDAFFRDSLCDAWDAVGMTPRRTYYNGTFELANDTLKTPILVLS
jgi:hypothetical protein